MTDESKAAIRDIVARREITELLHFTTSRGLVGCLAKGFVLPRDKLRADQALKFIATPNAPYRSEELPGFDKSRNWISYVNLSISEISTNLFRYSLRWHAGEDLFWVVMSFDPVLIEDEGVYFATTNNIYESVRRNVGSAGLDALFAETVARKRDWIVARRGRPPNLPTCEQAEVLYPERLPMTYLRGIYVEDGEKSDSAYAMLGAHDYDSVPVWISPEKFRGAAN